MNHLKATGRKIGFTLGTPLVTFLLLKLISDLFGKPGFAQGPYLQTILYTTVYTSMISLAMAYNLISGRFDFTVGSTLVLSAIIGGNLAKSMGLGAWGMLGMMVLVGAVMGVLSGLVYVLLGLPPMIISIGLAMVYEAIGFSLNKTQGVNLIGKFSLLVFAQPVKLIILISSVLVLGVIIFEYTRFGYNYHAIASGQKIAVDTGLNEKSNAVICWGISGSLLGISAAIFISKFGTLSPEVGLGSAQYFMGAFLPIFIGGALRRYSNLTIGVIIGALISAMLSSSFVKLGLNNSAQTILNGLSVLAILIYTANSYKIGLHKMHKAKINLATQSAQQASPVK